jgi:copper homeostasis protein
MRLNGAYILEISVETVEAARAAERGGAQRIELCANLAVGGVTPSAELVQAVRGEIGIPVFSMIRPRGGDFVYSDAESESMQRDITAAERLGIDGVVLGILKSDRTVDVARTRQLVELARPLPVTFHRAFDEALDFPKALEDVIQTGATRLLTSGGSATASEGAAKLAELIQKAGDRIIILPGGGINPGNLLQIVEQTGAREFHSGLSSSLRRPISDYKVFEENVRELVGALNRKAALKLRPV